MNAWAYFFEMLLSGDRETWQGVAIVVIAIGIAILAGRWELREQQREEADEAARMHRYESTNRALKAISEQAKRSHAESLARDKQVFRSVSTSLEFHDRHAS